MEYLASNSDIEAVTIGDETVELVCYVASKEAAGKVGQGNKQYDVMKFVVDNRQGKRIQCSVWGDDIPVVDPKIQPGTIIHVNGACACPVFTRSNGGNVKFDLSFRKKTEITTLETQAFPELVVDAEEVELENVSTLLDKFIIVEGFIKTPIRFIKVGSNYGFASAAICDCKETKLEIKISVYDPHSTIKDKTFELGSKVTVKGYPRIVTDKYKHEKLILEVHSVTDINVLESSLKTFPEMIKCVKSPRKTKQTESNSE